jgi:hypothetical protein
MKRNTQKLRALSIVLLLCLAFSGPVAFGQTEPQYKYMEIFPVKPKNNKPDLIISGYFGSLEDSPQANAVIYSPDQSPKKYNTFVEALNAFGKVGWQVKAVYQKYYPNNNRPVLTYLLEKKK